MRKHPSSQGEQSLNSLVPFPPISPRIHVAFLSQFTTISCALQIIKAISMTDTCHQSWGNQTKHCTPSPECRTTTIFAHLPTPALLTARDLAYHARTLMTLVMFCVFPSFFPCGFSSKRETARSLNVC